MTFARGIGKAGRGELLKLQVVSASCWLRCAAKVKVARAPSIQNCEIFLGEM